MTDTNLTNDIITARTNQTISYIKKRITSIAPIKHPTAHREFNRGMLFAYIDALQILTGQKDTIIINDPNFKKFEELNK